jgi:hypothetical protein
MKDVSLLAERSVHERPALPDAPDYPCPVTACPVTASEADIAEFRANLLIAKRHRRKWFSRLKQAASLRLPLPVALSHGLRGIASYGLGVRKRYGIGLFEQFRLLTEDNFSYRILPESFYMYQLYRPGNRELGARHFSFAELLPMQQYLIDAMACADFLGLRSKHRFARRCMELRLPTIPVVAEFAGGKMVRPVPGAGVMPLPQADLFSKPSEYWCGIGANLWLYQAPDRYINAVSGEACGQQSLLAKLSADSRSGRIVVQEKALNHSSLLGTLTSGGLATIRIVTCRTPGGAIDFMPAAIRMPIAQAIVDNIAQGGLAAPIDLASGEICGPAIQKDKAVGISRFERHPDTAVNLVGMRLPFWREALDLAKQAHLAFPSMPFVGWDIAILEGGPVVLEGNCWWDVDLTLLPHRKSLCDTQFVPYYNYHLRKTAAKAN